MIIKGTGGLGGTRTSGDHLNNNIIENSGKSPRDLWRLVTQTPVKDHQLKLKNSQEVNNDNNNNDKSIKYSNGIRNSFQMPKSSIEDGWID